MGKPSRDKGARRERQVVEMHRVLGVAAERVPGSGAYRYRGEAGDVHLPILPDAEAWVAEVKARASGEGFVTIERWLGENDALFLLRDRAPPVVVLPWARYQQLVLKARRS